MQYETHVQSRATGSLMRRAISAISKTQCSRNSTSSFKHLDLACVPKGEGEGDANRKRICLLSSPPNTCVASPAPFASAVADWRAKGIPIAANSRPPITHKHKRYSQIQSKGELQTDTKSHSLVARLGRGSLALCSTALGSDFGPGWRCHPSRPSLTA